MDQLFISVYQWKVDVNGLAAYTCFSLLPFVCFLQIFHSFSLLYSFDFSFDNDRISVGSIFTSDNIVPNSICCQRSLHIGCHHSVKDVKDVCFRVFDLERAVHVVNHVFLDG